MLELENFNFCPQNTRYYGGNAGNKFGITYKGENWILKFPKTTRDLHNPQISYTTSPLSEYLGSQIYELQGIAVHETVLGHAKSPTSDSERLVVACKDFRLASQQLTEFKDIKNAQFFSDGTEGTSGSGTILSEVLETIELSPAFEGFRDIVRERFWDQFIIDFVIGNNDRNNTNWGIIKDGDDILGLTPVFDNGNAFFNKRGLEQFEKRMIDEQDLRADAYLGFTCAYLTDEGHHIHPHELILSLQYEECNAALRRFMAKWDRKKVQVLFDDIPSYADKIAVLPQAQKDFYLANIDLRFQEVLLVAHEQLR